LSFATNFDSSEEGLRSIVDYVVANPLVRRGRPRRLHHLFASIAHCVPDDFEQIEAMLDQRFARTWP
jgi:hypothetical protein